jgi:phospholipid N-methyltransferase
MTKYNGVKTLEVLLGADNYNAWIASVLSPYIKSPVLEVGAGTGNISDLFKDQEDIVLTDNDTALVRTLQKKYESNKNITVEMFDIEKQLGKIPKKFKTIYAVNVLEHIKDDEKALINLNLMLQKEGMLVLLVPAKKFAYTRLDKNLGHYRRYEKTVLEKKLRKANFKIVKVEYFNVIGLFSWILRNFLTRNHNELKTNHVKLFDSIVPLLRRVEPTRGLPFGISLIAVARKTTT